MTTPADGPWTPPPSRGRGNRTLVLGIVGVLVVAAAVIVAIVVASGGDHKASTAAKSATTAPTAGSTTAGSTTAGSTAAGSTVAGSTANGGTGGPDAFASCGDLVKRLGTAPSKYKITVGGTTPTGVPLPATKPSAICTAKGDSATDTFLTWANVTKTAYDAQLTQAGWKSTTVSSYPFVTTLWVKPASKYEIITFVDGKHLVAFYGPPSA